VRRFVLRRSGPLRGKRPVRQLPLKPMNMKFSFLRSSPHLPKCPHPLHPERSFFLKHWTQGPLPFVNTNYTPFISFFSLIQASLTSPLFEWPSGSLPTSIKHALPPLFRNDVFLPFGRSRTFLGPLSSGP